MRIRTRRRLPVLVSLLLLGGGCSTFERDWEATGRTADAAGGLEGRWAGTWRSEVNGHTGGLRCILSTSEDGSLQARYHATYGCCFTFEFTVPMRVRPDGETYHFSGEADLGWLAGGRYEYEGTVVGAAFTSTYRSRRDHGVFQMTRVASPEVMEIEADSAY